MKIICKSPFNNPKPNRWNINIVLDCAIHCCEIGTNWLTQQIKDATHDEIDRHCGLNSTSPKRRDIYIQRHQNHNQLNRESKMRFLSDCPTAKLHSGAVVLHHTC